MFSMPEREKLFSIIFILLSAKLNLLWQSLADGACKRVELVEERNYALLLGEGRDGDFDFCQNRLS
jgi:hypothetical protein